MIYWFIGQPGSGKSTLAKEFQKYVNCFGRRKSIHLDGDDLRDIFKSGYTPDVLTPEYRKEQTRILQRFVAHLADQDVSIIVSTVNGYRDVREEFKKSRKDVVEIYVFKTENRGREKFNIPTYEVPERDFIHVDTTGRTVEKSLDILCLALEQRVSSASIDEYCVTTPTTIVQDVQRECAEKALEESLQPQPPHPLSILGNQFIGQER